MKLEALDILDSDKVEFVNGFLRASTKLPSWFLDFHVLRGQNLFLSSTFLGPFEPVVQIQLAIYRINVSTCAITVSWIVEMEMVR